MLRVSVVVARAVILLFPFSPSGEDYIKEMPLLVLSCARVRDGVTQAKCFPCLSVSPSWVSVLHMSAILLLYSRAIFIGM